MHKFKKFIASVLTSIMTFTAAATAAVAAVPADVADTKYEEAAEVLGVLEVMIGDENGNFRPDDTIIRAEVAKVGVAISGLSSVAESASGATNFPDVPSGYWGTGYINVANSQKLVIGDDKGNFRPDTEITYQEAVTILVRALGYEPQAQAKGGFPAGYLVTASDIGLTKGVSGSQTAPISRGDVAKLAFNALTISLMEQTGFGGDVNYEVVDKTLLTDKLDVEKITDQVKAVGSASLDGSSSLSKGQILIGDEIVKTGSADVRSVLGFTVDAYVKDDGRDKVLLLARPADGKNDSITIPAENLAEITTSGGKTEVKYWKDIEKDSKTTKATVKADASIIYNGKSGSAEDLKVIESGNIILLDTQGKGSYDVVFVNETVNYVVEEVVESSYKIVDKYGKKTLIADPDDDDLTFIITKGTEEISISDLNEWDVLTTTASKDGQLIYAQVSSEAVTGKVTEKSDDTYFINGKGYKVAANYTKTISLEDEGTFYLDIEGKIAAVDSESTVSSNYAYLAKAGLSTGMDKVLEMKVFTKDGKTEIIKTGDKVKVNGVSGKTPQQALDILKGSSSSADGQLITYETNSEGVVTKINTAETSSTINENKFILNMKEDDVEFKAASNKLVGSSMSINVNKNTVVFDIPAGKEDTSDFAIRNYEFFVDGDSYDLLAFDVTEDRTAKAIIITNSTGLANEESSLAIVDKITLGKNDDGEEIENLYAYQNGEKIELATSESGVLVKNSGGSEVSLKQGDVIQYKTNINGEIEKITLVFDIDTKAAEAEVEISDKMSTYYGKILKKFSSSFNMQSNDGAIHNFDFSEADIYTVDTTLSRNQISVGDAGDIQKYDELDPSRVFVRVYEDVVREVIIIK